MKLLAQSDMISVSAKYDYDCAQAQRYMVQNSSMLIAAFDGLTGERPEPSHTRLTGGSRSR